MCSALIEWTYDGAAAATIVQRLLQPVEALAAQSERVVTLSVVIPAFNEETRLPTMLHAALDYLQKRCKTQNAFTYEILVVDDGSSDQT